MKRVLLLGAGRRVSLAKCFTDKGFEVFSYETEKQCPISIIAQIVEGKNWNDAEIREHLITVIRKISPDLILGLADKALPILSSISHKGIVASSGRTNNLCLNKKEFET